MSIHNSLISVCTMLFFLISLQSFADTISPQTNVDSMPVQSQEEAQQQPTIEEAGFNKGRVARGIFTSDVVDREPVDNLTVITNDIGTVKYFTDLRDMSGHKVIHRWMHNGNVVSEVEFQVRGPRWRIWSSKNMQPSWLGQWQVSVINTVGEEIGTSEFEYTEPAPVSAMPPATSPATPQTLEASP